MWFCQMVGKKYSHDPMSRAREADSDVGDIAEHTQWGHVSGVLAGVKQGTGATERSTGYVYSSEGLVKDRVSL